MTVIPHQIVREARAFLETLTDPKDLTAERVVALVMFNERARAVKCADDVGVETGDTYVTDLVAERIAGDS